MKPVETFQNRLATALRIRNMKPVELHEKTNISESLISKYLSGNAIARQRKLSILSEALNINPVWLMGYDAPMENNVSINELGNPVVDIPLLDSVKSGYDYLAQENRIGTVKVETSLVEDGSDFFALKVKGDSMSPIFIEGDIVIVKKQNDCENNQIAIVIVNGDEGTIKKVRKTEQGIILKPLNPTYDPLIFTNQEIEEIPITIVGIVKQLKREF